MSFSFAKFEAFSKRLIIETKEEGLRPLFPLLGTQVRLFDELKRGLEDGIHHFVILKGRQSGVTTGTLALDLYWLFTHKGLHGGMISDNEKNRDQNRAYLTNYMNGLPPELKVPVNAHNRNQLLLANRSRLAYQVAGTRGGGSTGRGSGFALIHGTECSSWANEQALDSLNASLAQNNPDRLYIFESTALGHNVWFEMCESAKVATSQRFIFIGWWLHEHYRVPRDSLQFQTYWTGRLDPEEREWVTQVKRLYGFEISPEQIAWWRWQFFEYYHQDLTALTQEFPPTEHMAFVIAGSQWFNSAALTEAWNEAKPLDFSSYAYHFGDQFIHTIIWDAKPAKADLRVWEKPVPSGASYIVAADPAYGDSENADRFVCQVFRCYADRLDQVAEYCVDDIDTYKFAWVICHLAGYYSGAGNQITLTVEVNGPGRATIDEIRNLRRQAYTIKDKDTGTDIKSAVRHMSWYLYRRNDSLNGPSNFIGQVTSHELKQRMMNVLRDCVHRKLVHIKSLGMIEELRAIVRKPDGDIKGDGRAKDDRVMASGQAAVVWMEQVRPRMEVMKLTVERSKQSEQGRAVGMMDVVKENYFKNKIADAKVAQFLEHARPGARVKA